MRVKPVSNRSKMPNVGGVTVATLIALAALTAPAAAQSTKLVDTYSDWSFYAHKGAPADICFITSQPKETSPRGISREPAYFYVSHWPKDGVKSEVSLKLGYAVQQGSDVRVQIGNAQFTLFPKDDKAFVGDPTDELKLIEAMKRGSFMVVEATTAGGEATKDTYSLIGISKAVSELQSNCN